MKRVLPLLALLLVGLESRADEPKRLVGVAYGKHPRQVLDFYQAKSDRPTPVVFYIHGGGWQGGDKRTNPQRFLDKGISVVAINYRYVKHGVEEKVEPPVKAPLEDAARALQFIRSRAKEYSPIEDVSKDDTPIGLFYGGDKDAKVGDSPKDPTHSPILGIKLKEKLDSLGMDVVLVYPGHPHEKYKNSADYLIDRLLK